MPANYIEEAIESLIKTATCKEISDDKQAYKEIESLWKYGERELKENGQGEQLFIPETVKALEIAKAVLGSIEQIIWERDMAITQLKELGYKLGQKINRKGD